MNHKPHELDASQLRPALEKMLAEMSDKDIKSFKELLDAWQSFRIFGKVSKYLLLAILAITSGVALFGKSAVEFIDLIRTGHGT